MKATLRLYRNEILAALTVGLFISSQDLLASGANGMPSRPPSPPANSNSQRMFYGEADSSSKPDEAPSSVEGSDKLGTFPNTQPKFTTPDPDPEKEDGSDRDNAVKTAVRTAPPAAANRYGEVTSCRGSPRPPNCPPNNTTQNRNQQTDNLPLPPAPVPPEGATGNQNQTQTPAPEPSANNVGAVQPPQDISNRSQTTQPGNSSAGTLQEARQQVQLCRDAAKRARECCNNPAACTVGGGKEVGEAISALSALTAVGGAALVGSTGGDAGKLQKACSILQAIGYGSAAVNGGAATVCYTAKSSCNDECDEISKKYQEMVDNCTPEMGCTSATKSELQSQIRTGEANSRSCDALNGQISKSLAQGVVGGLGGQYAGLCAELSKASTGLPKFDTQPVFTTDCNNPANASNPACLNCSIAANQSNPLCRKPGGTLGDGASVAVSSPGNFGVGTANANVDGNAGYDGPGQRAITPEIKPAAASAKEVANNSGGAMLGGGGGGNPGFGIPDRPQGGGRGGYNTDIMQGVGGGGGYTVSSVPTAAGSGFSGYGSAAPNNANKAFDLRQYLPGGAKDPKRKIAGLGVAVPEMGSRFDDIFKRVNDRVNVLCRLERLMDCGKKR